jgi:hypothetical protein
VLPSTDWKRRAYRKPEQQRWYAGETISLGIGQGYNNFTMLQLASATATLVSGGQRFKPRLVREIEDVVTRHGAPVASEALPPLPLKPEHVALVANALHGRDAGRHVDARVSGAPYKSGGKTGTAQAVGVRQNEKYNAAKLEEHQRDHSLYIAMAPLEAPTIALAVVVENAGFGAEAAAPIARRVFDYVLLGQYPSEEDLAATRIGKSSAAHRHAAPRADVPLPGRPAAASALARAGLRAARPLAALAGAECRGEDRLRPPLAWQRLRRCSAASTARWRWPCCCWRRSAWSPCIRPASTTARASSTMAATCCWGCGAVRRGAGAAAEAAAPGGAAVRGGRAAAAGGLPGVGITKKGATRWLNVGIVIQPSEILKIAAPLMLAWWFQKREGQLRCSTSWSPARCCCCRWPWWPSSPTWAPRCSSCSAACT